MPEDIREEVLHNYEHLRGQEVLMSQFNQMRDDPQSLLRTNASFSLIDDLIANFNNRNITNIGPLNAHDGATNSNHPQILDLNSSDNVVLNVAFPPKLSERLSNLNNKKIIISHYDCNFYVQNT